jgi:hypothetical protein
LEVLSSLRFVVMHRALGGQFGFVSQVMCSNYIQFFVIIIDVLESNVAAQICFWWVNHVLILWLNLSLNLSLDFETSCQFYTVGFVLEFWSELSILWLDLWLDLWCFKGLSTKFCCHFSCAILKSYGSWDGVMVFLM